MRQLVDDAASFVFLEHNALGAGQRDVHCATAAIAVVDDRQAGRLGDDHRIAVVAAHSTGDSAVYSAKLLVHDRLADQVSLKRDAQFLKRAHHAQDQHDAAFHII